MDKVHERVLLEIKTSRTGEETPEAMVQFLASLVSLRKRLLNLVPVAVPITLEIGVVDQLIHFYISIPATFRHLSSRSLSHNIPRHCWLNQKILSLRY